MQPDSAQSYRGLYDITGGSLRSPPAPGCGRRSAETTQEVVYDGEPVGRRPILLRPEHAQLGPLWIEHRLGDSRILPR
jgi:hypothetical protein